MKLKAYGHGRSDGSYVACSALELIAVAGVVFLEDTECTGEAYGVVNTMSIFLLVGGKMYPRLVPESGSSRPKRAMHCDLCRLVASRVVQSLCPSHCAMLLRGRLQMMGYFESECLIARYPVVFVP